MDGSEMQRYGGIMVLMEGSCSISELTHFVFSKLKNNGIRYK